MNDIAKAVIVILVLGAAFAWAWRKGYVARFALYVRETREELRKCSWPSKEELRGSTAVVMITMLLLGAFVVLVDLVLNVVIQFFV